jgi:methyl-accepting chemotaxis protein
MEKGKIVHYFTGSHYDTDIQGFIRARQYVVVSISGSLFFLFNGFKWLSMGQPAVGISCFAVVAVSVAFLYTFRLFNTLRLSGNATLLVYMWHFIFFTIKTGGLHDFAFVWFAVVPIAALLITPGKTAVFWGIVSLLFVLVLNVLHKNGIDFAPMDIAFEQHESSRMINMLGSLLATLIGTSFLYTSNKNLLIELNKNLSVQKELTEKQIAAAAEAKELNEHMQAIIQGITDNTKALNDTSRKLSDFAGEMKDSTGKVKNYSENSSQFASKINGHLAEINDAVSGANDYISHVFDAVRISAGHTAETTDKISSSRPIIKSLGESAEQIEKIAELILDLSEQTKLLGLYATIEAARAGEAGKSFTVVSSEIQELSKQTSSAVSKIEGILNENTQNIERTTALLEDINKVAGILSENNAAVKDTVENQQGKINIISEKLLSSETDIRTVIDYIGEMAGKLSTLSDAIDNVYVTSKEMDTIAGNLKQACEKK